MPEGARNGVVKFFVCIKNSVKGFFGIPIFATLGILAALAILFLGVPLAISHYAKMSYQAAAYSASTRQAQLPLNKRAWEYSYVGDSTDLRGTLFVCWDRENKESTLDLTGGRLNFDLCQEWERGKLVGTVSTTWNPEEQEYEGTLRNFVDETEAKVWFTPPTKGDLRQEGLTGVAMALDGSGEYERLTLRPDS